MMAPVTKVERRETRNRTAPTSSSGSANLFIKAWANSSSITAGCERDAAVSGVAIRPGAMALTRIPLAARSAANPFVNCTTASDFGALGPVGDVKRDRARPSAGSGYVRCNNQRTIKINVGEPHYRAALRQTSCDRSAVALRGTRDDRNVTRQQTGNSRGNNVGVTRRVCN